MAVVESVRGRLKKVDECRIAVGAGAPIPAIACTQESCRRSSRTFMREIDVEVAWLHAYVWKAMSTRMGIALSGSIRSALWLGAAAKKSEQRRGELSQCGGSSR